MKKCGRCGYSIEGTPIEIVPFSSSGAKPTTYRHATDADCNEAARKIRVDARRTSRLSRYL
ncbi:hypothetical protein [Nocardioides sp. NPDC006273]|uniref:hypothetical protein n=1 Tax=Actinomycetes TaxID=1760 RepID=UPI0033B70C2D